MIEVPPNTCADCRFFDLPHPDRPNGFCRRRAPVPMGTRFPVVGKDEWCGEWQFVPRFSESCLQAGRQQATGGEE